MNTYQVEVVLTVEIQAFDEGDAMEAVEDCFGQGDACGLKVTEFSIESHTEL